MGKLNFPTTYREDRLVGKSTRPLITFPERPHHLWRRGARGEAAGLNFPTTYRDEGLVGKLLGSTSPPPIEKRGSWGSWQPDVR